ncbi:glycoside hydrolase family 31 protein [Bombardia bombarda]|uniref:alpha-glucosidase n=1 Tax=Bombardia bombarda TaxID=252184 RepID=A0AA39WUU5_9PEZI|nr:glycoside hydrolase family 31 protein [Bombardia bombarda]
MSDPTKADKGPPNRYTFKSAPVANPGSIVQGATKNGYYRFTVLTQNLVRYEWSEDGGFEDRASTLALFRQFEVPAFCAEIDGSNGGQITIFSKWWTLKFQISAGFSPEGLQLAVEHGGVWRYDGKSYGDLGGTARTLDTADGRIPLDPGLISRNAKYGVIDDSDSMVFDENGWIATRKPGRKDGYVFAYSDGGVKTALRDFYRLSDRQPILPRWALGNWWSRYHAYSATEYLELMDHFKKEEIPLNVGVLDMDWHRVDDVPKKYGSGWTGYSWNRNLFPNPDAFLQELHKRGLKIAVNDHPADGIRAFETLYPCVALVLGKDIRKGEPVEFDCTDKKFMDAYFDILKLALEKQGIDFWWIDWQQGNKSKIPGIDPLWVLNHFHYLVSQRNVASLERKLTFSRYAGPGSHRYPIGFSGDTIISWASLAFQPEFTATASNIGYGWWSHDIGGHYWGTRSNELTARWAQLGCFSPILRLHSEKSQWNSKEPWKYEPEAAQVMKDFLILRHRLIPFLYTMNVRAHKEGEPLVQPMYWKYEGTPEAYTVPNQYFYGPSLIVAPITAPHSPATLTASVRAWLPFSPRSDDSSSGHRYIDILNPGLVYDGGRYVNIHRTLSSIPVLAQEGTIIPLDAAPKFENGGSSRPKDILILLVVGKDAFFELVEEADSQGEKDRSAPEVFTRTPIAWVQHTSTLTIGPVYGPGGDSDDSVLDRNWSVRLVGHGAKDSTVAMPSDAPVPRILSETKGITLPLGTLRRPTTPVFRSHNKVRPIIQTRIGDNLQLDVVDIPARLHEMLYRCEMGYQTKETVWQLVTGGSDEPMAERVRKLWKLDMDEEIKSAVMEVWGADGRAEGTAAGLEGVVTYV